MVDKNSRLIQIGDIVKIEGSPFKSDNALYVVAQDGTSKMYPDKHGLTLYRVSKVKSGGYSLSKAKNKLNCFPLSNYSNRYKYTRVQMDAATIEIIKKSNPEAFTVVTADGRLEATGHGFEEPEKDYFYAVVLDGGGKGIVDFTYFVSQAEKLTALFSNITLKEGQEIKITKITITGDALLEWVTPISCKRLGKPKGT